MAASSSTIRAAIHSPASDAETLTRINAVLALYFEPETDAKARAAIREEYVRALSRIPPWAMHQACDAWVRSGSRRPTPGELVMLAQRALQPFTDELARRQRAEEVAKEEAEARHRNRVTPEAAASIMAERGFTEERLAAVMRRPMARTMDEAEQRSVQREPHWTERLAPDDPRIEALRAARARNPLMNQGQEP